jgi:tetratricopeptide (TPR) repeat protein
MKTYQHRLIILVCLISVSIIGLSAAWGATSKPCPSELFTNLWFDAIKTLQEKGYEEAKDKLDCVSTKRQEAGLENLVEASDILVRENNQLEKRGNSAVVESLLEMANNLAPYNWRVQFALAKLHLVKLDLYKALKEFLRGLKNRILDFYSSYSLLNAMFLLVGLSLFAAFSVVIVFSFLQVHRAVFHDVKELISESLPILPVYIVGWFFLAFVFWIGGFFWFVLLLTILVWGYLDLQGKKFIQAFLIFVFFLPLILMAIGITLDAYNDPYIKALRDVTYGMYTGKTEEVLRKAVESNSLDKEAIFSLAFINKKKGLLDTAERGYKDLVTRSYQVDKVYNNLGNIYYAQKKMKDAIQSYENALNKNPKSFSAHYNLAQAYLQDALSTEKANNELNQAQRLDYSRFERVRETAADGSHYNLVLVDEPLSRLTPFISSVKLWKPGYKVAEEIWGLFSKVKMPFYFLSVVSIVSWVLIKVFHASRKKGGHAYYCQMCGDAICYRCQQSENVRRFCTQCNYIFTKKSVSQPGKKEEKVRQIQNYEQARKWAARIASLLLPGSGHVYSGFIGKGFVIAMLVAVFLFALYFQNFFLQSYKGAVPGLVFPFFIAKLVVLAGIYLFTLRDIFTLSPKN